MDIHGILNSSNESNLDRLHVLVADFRQTVLPVTIFVGTELVLGLLFNLTVMYVLTVKYDRSTLRCFILFLTFIDIISCFTSMAGEIVTEIYWFDFPLPAICRCKSFFNIFTVDADVLCLLAIAIDRYKRMCLPDKAQIPPPLAMYLCAGIFLVAVAVASPGAVLGDTHSFPYLYNGSSIDVSVCGHVDNSFARTYIIFLQSMAFFSLATTLLLYVVITREVFCQRHKGKTVALTPRGCPYEPLLSDSQEERSENVRRRTAMMMLVTVLFIVTVATYLILELIFSKKLKTMTVRDTVIFSLFLRFYFIIHVINPIIYGFMDPRFRILLNISRRSTPKAETSVR